MPFNDALYCVLLSKTHADFNNQYLKYKLYVMYTYIFIDNTDFTENRSKFFSSGIHSGESLVTWSMVGRSQ